MSKLKDLFSKLFPAPKPITVFEAYTTTKYGLKLNIETLKKKCIEEISSLMSAKSLRNSYSLVFDLDENIPELTEYLQKYYKELGFNCFVLDSKVDSRIESPKLYLSWSKRTCSKAE